MLEFEILARGFYRPDQLDISYEPSLTMPVTAVIQEWMDVTWQERLAEAKAQNFPLYDSQLFRLIHAEAQADGKLHVVVGNTSYKEYLTSRIAEFANGRTRQELGNALAVCSVVETTDGFILYERRQKTAIHRGRYHVIAGFFERERDSDKAGQPDPFAAMRRELREETGITAQDIHEEYCLGAVYDISNPHGELCFFTRLNITLAEVHTRIPEDDEIQQLLALHVTEESLRDFLLSNHDNISATGEPNLLMYGALRFGEPWFQHCLTNLW